MVHTLNNLFKAMEGTKEEMEYQVSMGYLEVCSLKVLHIKAPPPHVHKQNFGTVNSLYSGHPWD